MFSWLSLFLLDAISYFDLNILTIKYLIYQMNAVCKIMGFWGIGFRACRWGELATRHTHAAHACMRGRSWMGPACPAHPCCWLAGGLAGCSAGHCPAWLLCCAAGLYGQGLSSVLCMLCMLCLAVRRAVRAGPERCAVHAVLGCAQGCTGRA